MLASLKAGYHYQCRFHASMSLFGLSFLMQRMFDCAWISLLNASRSYSSGPLLDRWTVQDVQLPMMSHSLVQLGCISSVSRFLMAVFFFLLWESFLPASVSTSIPQNL
jgi:hypothetical protein